MEQEIQTCRFNSAGKGREAPSPSIHSLRRDSSLFPFSFTHCFLSASFTLSFFLSSEIRCVPSQRSSRTQSSSALAHAFVRRAGSQPRMENVRLRRRDISAAVSKELLLLLESHLKLWLSHQVHTRHLVGLFFFFFLFLISSSAGVANTQSSFNIDVLNAKKGNHVCACFFSFLASEYFAIAFHSAITPRSVISPMSLLGGGEGGSLRRLGGLDNNLDYILRGEQL